MAARNTTTSRPWPNAGQSNLANQLDCKARAPSAKSSVTTKMPPRIHRDTISASLVFSQIARTMSPTVKAARNPVQKLLLNSAHPNHWLAANDSTNAAIARPLFSSRTVSLGESFSFDLAAGLAGAGVLRLMLMTFSPWVRVIGFWNESFSGAKGERQELTVNILTGDCCLSLS